MSNRIFLMSARERSCTAPIGALCGRSVPSSA
jgi:hypothetical protein